MKGESAEAKRRFEKEAGILNAVKGHRNISESFRFCKEHYAIMNNNHKSLVLLRDGKQYHRRSRVTVIFKIVTIMIAMFLLTFLLNVSVSLLTNNLNIEVFWMRDDYYVWKRKLLKLSLKCNFCFRKMYKAYSKVKAPHVTPCVTESII